MFSAWHRRSCRCIRPKARRVHIHKAENSAALERVATTDLFHVSQRKTWPRTANGELRTFFRSIVRSLLFRHFSFRPSPLKAAKWLRKDCGKIRAQRRVQKMRKRRGKSADSAAD